MITKLKKGIIVSIQGYSESTTKEMAKDAISAGAVAIRTDKNIYIHDVPIIGLKKIKVKSFIEQPYITPTIKEIEDVKVWADFIAIDFRILNKNLSEIVEYCRHNQLNIIADISSMADYKNIIDNNYNISYITTALSVLYLTKPYFPDKLLIKRLSDVGCTNLIAEGNYQYVDDVREAYQVGSHNVCIGSAISNIYKLTKKYTRISAGWKPNDNENTCKTIINEIQYNE
jgi:putative N-acetylmannosamine-6-phosphate epimerase